MLFLKIQNIKEFNLERKKKEKEKKRIIFHFICYAIRFFHCHFYE